MAKIGGGTVTFCPKWTRSMTTADDTLDKLATETAASPAAEALKALERDSAAAALKAAQSTLISDEFEEMQRRLKSIEPVPNLAVGMVDLESPAMKAAREIA